MLFDLEHSLVGLDEDKLYKILARHGVVFEYKDHAFRVDDNKLTPLKADLARLKVTVKAFC